MPASASGPVAGPAATSANKTLYVGGPNMLLIGFTNPPSPAPGIPSKIAFGDGPVFSFSYAVPAAAVIGSTVTVALGSLKAANSTGTAVAMTSTPLNLTIGIAPSCQTAINSNINNFLATPSGTQLSDAVLGQIVLELVTASTTGTCT